MKERLKLIPLSTLALSGGFIMIIKFEPLHDLFNTIVAFHIEVKVLVGLVAILTGAAGISSCLDHSRPRRILKSVKVTFDKGDCKELTDSRQYLSKHWNKDDFMISKAAPILNFYQQWGLLNRKDFLPLWVFEGAFGIRVVEMTIQLSSHIIKGRTDNDHSLIQNIYYAEAFENLAKRIYKKYPSRMEHPN